MLHVSFCIVRKGNYWKWGLSKLHDLTLRKCFFCYQDFRFIEPRYSWWFYARVWFGMTSHRGPRRRCRETAVVKSRNNLPVLKIRTESKRLQYEFEFGIRGWPSWSEFYRKKNPEENVGNNQTDRWSLFDWVSSGAVSLSAGALRGKPRHWLPIAINRRNKDFFPRDGLCLTLSTLSPRNSMRAVLAPRPR